MNKNELVDWIAKDLDVSKSTASDALESVLSAIKYAISQGNSVRLVNFGTFSISERKATEGRDPRSGERITVPAFNAVRFRPGKGLKDIANGKATIETEE